MFRAYKFISSKSQINLYKKNTFISTNFINNSNKFLKFINKNFFKKTNYLQAAKKDYYSILYFIKKKFINLY